MQRILQEITEKNNAWNMSRLAHRPSVLTYYIEDLQISKEGQQHQIYYKLDHPGGMNMHNNGSRSSDFFFGHSGGWTLVSCEISWS